VLESAHATDLNDQSASVQGTDWNFFDWANELAEPMDVTAAPHDLVPSQTWNDLHMADAFQNSNDIFLHNGDFLNDGMTNEQTWQPTALYEAGSFKAMNPQAFINPSDTDLLGLPQPSQSVVVGQSPLEFSDESISQWAGLEKDLMHVFNAEFPGQGQFEPLESSTQGLTPPSTNAPHHLPGIDNEKLDRESSSPVAMVTDGASPSGDYDGNRLVSCATCQKIVKRRKLQ
jgi:hypothetical protein